MESLITNVTGYKAFFRNFAVFALLCSFLVTAASAVDEQGFLTALSKAGIQGSIVPQGDISFPIDSVPWNLRCYPKPLAIIYVQDANDASLAVTVAATFGVPVQPRSGGHSFGSHSLGGWDGALVIDLKNLDTVDVDQTTWQATIGGGTRLDKVTSGLYDQGQRAIAHGTCPQVGIGGHATIGGQGPLSRMWGLSLDHVVEVEVVLANGTITRANSSQNADLFWALRGAGASFGIITAFIVETHPAPTAITQYSVQISIGSSDDLATAFKTWQSFISTPAVFSDRAFNSVISITRSSVIIQGNRLGTRAELEASEAYIHLSKLGVDLQISELDWLASVLVWAEEELQNIGGGIPIPLYVKNLVVRQSHPLKSETIDAWFANIQANATNEDILVILGDLQGGRISDFPNNATAYAQRDSMYTIAAYAVSVLPYPADTLAFLNGMINTIMTAQPDADFGAYPGYIDPLLPSSLWPQQYWGANYPRLKQIKAAYDPKDVFSNPQSVGQA